MIGWALLLGCRFILKPQSSQYLYIQWRAVLSTIQPESGFSQYVSQLWFVSLALIPLVGDRDSC